jgi:predicted Zn-dependent peptidase
VSQELYLKKFDNGLVLVAEHMPWLESTATSFHIANGYVHDPADAQGLCNLTCEMVQRGCGDYTSRQFVEALENLGVDHSASLSSAHTTYTAAVLAENLYPAMKIYADLVRRPHLPEEQLEDARQVCLHEIRAVDDDFAQKTMQQLRLKHYGEPFGRSASGLLEPVERLTIEDVQQFFQRCYGAQKSILAVAGKFRWEDLERQVGELFGDWASHKIEQPREIAPARGYTHLQHDSNQTHIALACPSVPYGDPNFFLARGAIGVLSDGVSSRLFTEVREKRGLVYSVNAFCHSFLDRGSVLSYAGTTTERAQETLDVVLQQMTELRQGIRGDELSRVKARIKSGLIMQQESSSARSGAIAGDWYFWGRIRTIEELKEIIDGLTVEAINDYIERHPLKDFTIVTFGAKRLEVNGGVS